MRIGLLTMTLHANYGGILQAYALQTVLEGMGHDVSSRMIYRENQLEESNRLKTKILL